jgi:hypothetical protein
MGKVTAMIKKELLEMIPPTIFFFVALSIVAVARVLMTRGTGLPAASVASIAIAALILGKSVLIADLLPIINRFPEKPLIYNIVWKTTIYLLISAAIHYLERLWDFSREAGGIVAGNEKLLAEIIWPHWWAVEIILLVLIAAYCTIHELSRLIGKERMLRIFFGPTPLPVA